MQKIDTNLCIFIKWLFEAGRYKKCDKQEILDYLTCPDQAQAVGIWKQIYRSK